MQISIIVARTENNVIGKDNQIPWYLPADLKYFKQTTVGHHIIMGRKCYESIGKPLPGRINIVITRQKKYEAPGCLVVHSLEHALDIARIQGEDEAFIIGGAEIYRLALEQTTRLYITEVHAKVEGDVFFPEIGEDWILISEQHNDADDRNEFDYTFTILEKSQV